MLASLLPAPISHILRIWIRLPTTRVALARRTKRRETASSYGLASVWSYNSGNNVTMGPPLNKAAEGGEEAPTGDGNGKRGFALSRARSNRRTRTISPRAARRDDLTMLR